MVLRKARVGANSGQVIHEDHECGEDDDDDCAFFSTILTPNQTAAIVKMIKQVGIERNYLDMTFDYSYYLAG